MTTTIERTIWCEDEGCVQWEQFGQHDARTVPMLRSAARRLGWRRRNGQDLCPHHAGTCRRAECRQCWAIGVLRTVGPS
jgi:hypothetical protein